MVQRRSQILRLSRNRIRAKSHHSARPLGVARVAFWLETFNPLEWLLDLPSLRGSETSKSSIRLRL
jgi:hypothetical protein